MITKGFRSTADLATMKHMNMFVEKHKWKCGACKYGLRCVRLEELTNKVKHEIHRCKAGAPKVQNP